MAIGWKNSSSRPEGRRGFGEAPNVIQREVVTPTKYGDGQDRDGTPYGRESTAASRTGYADAAAHRYRAEIGNTPHPGMGRGHRGGDNPDVHSKGATFHGKAHKPGKVGSPGEEARLSGGRLAAELYRDPVRPSDSPRAHTDRVPLGGISRRVGWLGDGQPFAKATHSTTGRHGSDGIHDHRVSTDAAQGQAWHASGGQHGSPSPRRPSRDHAPPPGATVKVRTSKLDKSEYVGGNKGRGPSTR